MAIKNAQWRFIRMSIYFAIAMLTFSKSGIWAQIPSASPDGARIFAQQCAACHSMIKGEIRVGPSLHNIMGRRAGKSKNFTYSSALKSSQIKWDATNLDQWLTDSDMKLPGSNMNFRQANAQKRKAVIDYVAKNSSK